MNQPKPLKNKQPHINDLVISDLKQRKVSGKKKYGTELQAFNKRNSVQDAYEECLDLVQYFKQLLVEREETIKVLKRCALTHPEAFELLKKLR